MKTRSIGMTINHIEIEHTLQQMADVIRNAAYKVANELYPLGHGRREEWFDANGTLLVMDEISIKSLLKDAMEHYLQFHTATQNSNPSDFNYYLNDSFEMVSAHITAQPQVISYLSASFASMCGQLAATLAPVIEDLSLTGHCVDQIEAFTLNAHESYYLVMGDNPDLSEQYDRKEDDLSTVDTYQTPDVLEAISQREHNRIITASVNTIISNGSINDQKYMNLDKTIKSVPLSPHIEFPKTLNNLVYPDLGNF